MTNLFGGAHPAEPVADAPTENASSVHVVAELTDVLNMTTLLDTLSELTQEGVDVFVATVAPPPAVTTTTPPFTAAQFDEQWGTKLARANGGEGLTTTAALDLIKLVATENVSTMPLIFLCC